jgi:hypothetical protein
VLSLGVSAYAALLNVTHFWRPSPSMALMFGGASVVGFLLHVINGHIKVAAYLSQCDEYRAEVARQAELVDATRARSRAGRQATEPAARRTRQATDGPAHPTTEPAAGRTPAGQGQPAAGPVRVPVVATGPRPSATEPGPAKPVLHAVRADESPFQPQPDRIDSDEVDVDVSDLVEDALAVARELGGRLSRDALIDGLRERGKSVGGRRRAAIYSTVKARLAADEATEPGRPAATGG